MRATYLERMTIPGVTSPISDNSAPFELKGLSRSAADEEVAFFRDSGATVDVVSEGADLFTVRIISTDGAIQRVIVMLPGAPKAAVEALRAAIPRVNADKLYAEEAEKAFGFVPQWEASPDTNKVAQAALTVRPEVRTFLADYMKNLPK